MVKVKEDACFDSHLHMETVTIFYAFGPIGLGSRNQKQSLKISLCPILFPWQTSF